MPTPPPDADDEWARFGGDPAERSGGPRRGPEPRRQPRPAPADARSQPAALRSGPAPAFDGPAFDGPDFDGPGFGGRGFDGPEASRPDGPDDDDFDPDTYDPGPARARELPTVPVRRLLALALAGLSLVVTVALVVGSQLAHRSYAFVVFAIQVLFVVVWTMASRPPAPRIVAAVGLAVAVVADIYAVTVNPASLAPLVYTAAGGFVVAVLGQMARPAGRVRVTESLGSSLVVVLGAVSGASLVVLSRLPLGTQVINAVLIGVGAALVSAHVLDAVAPLPRVAPSVPRGGIGVVVGAMVGTAAAGAAGALLEGLHPLPTAMAGLAGAVIALMVDLAANYAEASRQMAGGTPALWLVRHLTGPLSAFALAAPTAYAASMVLARGF